MKNGRYRFLTRTVRFYRNKFFHPFWELLNKFSIYGMNYHAAFYEVNGELEVIRLIRSNFGPNPIIIDAGAYTGGYAISLLEIITEPEHLYIFEPLRPNFEALQKNISPRYNVTLLNHGLSNVKEKLIMNFSTDVDATASIYQNINGNVLSHLAEFITLDGFINEQDITFIDFLKLDAEGHEFRILEGCRDALKEKKIKAIQFEFGPYNIKSQTFFRDFYDLLGADYKIYKILNNGVVEISRYSTYLEKFITANYLAVLKDSDFQY